jgi:adenosylmethionine-8-amino-7-oxononanoate aminotransferase
MIKMDDTSRNNTTNTHSRFAGRVACGLEQPVTIQKKGVRHVSLMIATIFKYIHLILVRLLTTWYFSTCFVSLQIRRLPSGEEKEILSVGLACSECFSGPRLAKLLKPGFAYEQKVMEDLMSGDYASPLSIHTSGGVPEALCGFVEALEPHLPWKNSEKLDWCVSIQLEGASAVWAAIDMVLQESILTSGNQNRKLVAVGEISYHGPPSTSAGGKCTLWEKAYQVKYPVPIAGQLLDEADLVSQFQAFLDQYGDKIGVMLIEPQWGSSQAAYPWPKGLLKTYFSMAKARGIRIVADEIMCGLGRHGQGSLFVSTDWELDPDAITFGKAIGGGVYPISGAILKRGRQALCANGQTVMQSHTYAGSSVRALMTATESLKEITYWLPSISKLGEEMAHIFQHLSKISDGMMIAHGQGLMWGCLFNNVGELADPAFKARAMKSVRSHCDEIGVLPYFVPAGGFMVTPVVDIDVGTIYEIGQKLEQAILRTMEEMAWNLGEVKVEEKSELLCIDLPSELVAEPTDQAMCVSYLHQTKSCTLCTDFVSRDVRMHFVRFKI